MSVCYILIRNDGRASYCGVTNCLERRLKQHNGRMQGGARYTRGHRWSPLCVVQGFCTRAQALSFEWHVKHCATPSGGVVRRRAHQVFVTLRSGAWWKRHPPCPRRLSVRWLGTGEAPRWPDAEEVPFTIACEEAPVVAPRLVAVHAAADDHEDAAPVDLAPVLEPQPAPPVDAPHGPADAQNPVDRAAPAAPPGVVAVVVHDGDGTAQPVGEGRPDVDGGGRGHADAGDVLGDGPGVAHEPTAAAGHALV